MTVKLLLEVGDSYIKAQNIRCELVRRGEFFGSFDPLSPGWSRHHVIIDAGSRVRKRTEDFARCQRKVESSSSLQLRKFRF